MSSPERQNTTGLKLVSSARAELHLPDSTPFLHFETTDYFTPDGRDYPMPHNNVYIQVQIWKKTWKIKVFWNELMIRETSLIFQVKFFI